MSGVEGPLIDDDFVKYLIGLKIIKDISGWSISKVGSIDNSFVLVPSNSVQNFFIAAISTSLKSKRMIYCATTCLKHVDGK